MRFLSVISSWVNRHFANEEAIYLVVLIVAVMLVLLTLGTVLAPVLTALVLAFVLQGLVSALERLRIPTSVAVMTTFVMFVGAVIATAVFLVPRVIQQTQALLAAAPRMLEQGQTLLTELPSRYPQFISHTQVDAWLSLAQQELANWGQRLLEISIAQVPGMVGLVIYLVLVPTLVFFFLKDKDQLLSFVGALLPAQRPLLNRVGAEMNIQIANYVRGKFVEIVIVGVATYVAFIGLGVKYAALLSVAVALSVIVPFVGAAVVTIPVVAVAMLQWGLSSEFWTVVGVYAVIQALDGYVLVPLLFSEVVDLHPVVIILAVLVFGGIWGLWGVFFAIPLATLVKAVYFAWPGADVRQQSLVVADAAPLEAAD